MDCVRWKKVSITGTQGVGFVTDAQFQLAAQNPVRLIFGVRMRAVFCSRGVSPLEDAVTFALQARLQLLLIRPRLFTPSIDLNTHRSEEHTSELQSQSNLVCRLLLEKKKK